MSPERALYTGKETASPASALGMNRLAFLVAQTGVPSGSCETPQAKACATVRWKQRFD